MPFKRGFFRIFEYGIFGANKRSSREVGDGT